MTSGEEIKRKYPQSARHHDHALASCHFIPYSFSSPGNRHNNAIFGSLTEQE